MTATTTPTIVKRIDGEVDALIAERDTVLRLPPSTENNARLATLFDDEAMLWGELHDATSSTALARAAIRARQYAQTEAARWRARHPQHSGRAA